MTDDEVKTFEQLLDKKLSQNHEAVTNQIAALSKRVEDGFATTATVGQVDAIAKHLDDTMKMLDNVTTTLDDVVQTQREQSQQFDRIERKLGKHDDRFEVLEAKTTHLPTRPRGT